MFRPLAFSAILLAAGSLPTSSVLAQPDPPVCTASPADNGAIADTIRTAITAAIAGDVEQFHANTTRDFFTFDGGRRFTGDELLAIMRRHLADGWNTTWTIENPEIRIDCNTALTTYTAHAVFNAAGNRAEMSLLESAYLRKAGSKWQVVFVHTTAIPAPPEKK